MKPRRSQAKPSRRAGARGQILRVLYEDDHIIAVSKPAGMVTQTPRPDGRLTLMDRINDHVHSSGSPNARVRVINRLDPEVSGVVLCAKSKPAEAKLSVDVRTNKIRRTYAALVHGEFAEGAMSTGTVETGLVTKRDGTVHIASKKSLKRSTAKKQQAVPKPAITHFRVREQLDGYALLDVRPETHRHQQIGVHLAHIEHPIVGDPAYPSPKKKGERLALHLEAMSLSHPITGEGMEIADSTPPEFLSRVGIAPEHNAQEPASIPIPAQEPANRQNTADDTSWQRVADWYSRYQSDARSDHFRDVIHPRAVELLGDITGKRVLDVACGEGTFAAILTELGATVCGIDAAASLIDTARQRGIPGAAFEAADAARIGDLSAECFSEPFDAACCVMALMNIEPIDAVLAGIASRLKPGAPLVAVILHPSFRSPGRTSWGWETDRDGARTQFRRVDAYLSESAEPITMNPGAASSGDEPVVTWTFHRPLERCVAAFSQAGFTIDAIEEWASERQSQPGPHADEENRIRSEIPMFMGIRAVRQPSGQS